MTRHRAIDLLFGVVAGALGLAVGLTLLVLVDGCGASTRDVTVNAVNTAALVGTRAQDEIAARYKAAEDACFRTAEPVGCVERVRVRFAPAWVAYGAYVATWALAAAAVQAPDGHPEAALPAVLKAGQELEAAMAGLVKP